MRYRRSIFLPLGSIGGGRYGVWRGGTKVRRNEGTYFCGWSLSWLSGVKTGHLHQCHHVLGTRPLRYPLPG